LRTLSPAKSQGRPTTAPRIPLPSEGVNWCHNLVVRTFIRLVYLKTDIRGRPEILARGVNRRRVAEAANILADGLRHEGSRRLVQPAKEISQIVLRIELNKMFWEGRRLDQEEPSRVLRRKLLISLSVHRQRRSDVDETSLFEAFRKVETQPVSDASTSIVRANKGVPMPK
jgi:hypothetical protein